MLDNSTLGRLRRVNGNGIQQSNLFTIRGDLDGFRVVRFLGREYGRHRGVKHVQWALFLGARQLAVVGSKAAAEEVIGRLKRGRAAGVVSNLWKPLARYS